MTQATHLLDLDPKLVFDLAARVDPPHVVASNYGLDPQFLAEMMETPHVKRAITQKRKELDEGGYVLAAKAKLMFEDLLPDVYRRAKGENTTLSGVLEAAKFLRTVAGLDKQDVTNQQQEKFSITIQFSNPPPGSQPVANSVTVIDMNDIPAAPGYIPKASNAELEYVE